MTRYLTAAVLIATANATAAAPTSLTDPKDLSDWEAQGGEWTLEDGVITGRATDGENAWLIYRGGTFSDFELAVEFRTPEPANGGVQFRSHWLPRTPLEESESLADAPKRMYGYQANVETRQRLASGRLIDENGRGPLAETPMPAAKTLKQRDWNSMTIRAVGGAIEIYLGNVLAHRTEDEAYLAGNFALQCFAWELDEAVVQYRIESFKDLRKPDAWRPLFDGKTLDGWKAWGSEDWVVEDGVIAGRSGEKKSEGYLATKETWTDFRVRGEFKMLGDGNYGLFYHSTITLREDGYPVIAGVQGEVEPAVPSATGWLYESYQRGWLVDPTRDTPATVVVDPDDWNSIEIRAVDNDITTWVNGIRAVDFDDPEPRLTQGSFALQLHAGGVAGILWRDLAVRR